MPRFRVSGKVEGSHYAGVFEADSKEAAMEKANEEVSPSLCHQCAGQCEDPTFEATDAEELGPDEEE